MKENMINKSMFIAPTVAVLLTYFGIESGGTGYRILDLVIFLISIGVCYTFIFFLKSYSKDYKIISYIIFIPLSLILSYEINIFLPIFTAILFIHLALFTPKKKINKIEEIKPVLTYSIQYLPIINKIFFLFYILVIIYLAYM